MNKEKDLKFFDTTAKKSLLKMALATGRDVNVVELDDLPYNPKWTTKHKDAIEKIFAELEKLPYFYREVDGQGGLHELPFVKSLSYQDLKKKFGVNDFSLEKKTQPKKEVK
jgi:hypothetical protein